MSINRSLTLRECREFWFEMMMAVDHHMSLGTLDVTEEDFNKALELWSIYSQWPDHLFTPGMDDNLFSSQSY